MPHLCPQAYNRVVAPEQLVTSGPFALVQHPIYTSYMLLFAGHALRWVGWVGSAAAGFVRRLTFGRTGGAAGWGCNIPSAWLGLHRDFCMPIDMVKHPPAGAAASPTALFAAWAAPQQLPSSSSAAFCTTAAVRGWRKQC